MQRKLLIYLIALSPTASHGTQPCSAVVFSSKNHIQHISASILRSRALSISPPPPSPLPLQPYRVFHSAHCLQPPPIPPHPPTPNTPPPVRPCSPPPLHRPPHQPPSLRKPPLQPRPTCNHKNRGDPKAPANDLAPPRAQLREGGAVAPPLPSTNQPAAVATICAGKTQSLQKMWLRVGCTSQP